MAGKSKLLEKIEYEQKLKRQYVWRCVITAILLVMVNILYVFNRERKVNCQEMSIWWLLVDYFFWGVILVGSWIFFSLLCVHLQEQRDDKMAEFNSKEAEEKFVQYLGKRRIKIKFQLCLNGASNNFTNTVKNPKIKWYVERNGVDLYRLTAYKGSKKVFDDIVEYEFLYAYFALGCKE